jgi:hypothetical protein
MSCLLSETIKLIIGHPFDTIKTWKQNYLLNTPKMTISNLYRGIKYPFFQNTINLYTSVYTNKYFLTKTRNIPISNTLSGIITTILTCPFDAYKIAEQQHIKKLYKFNEIIKLYKNLPISLTRNILGNVIFFTCYDKIKKYNFSYYINGTIAGCTSWLVIYPIDTIKTRIQSGTYSSIKNAINDKYLYRGFSMCIVRVIVINNCTLYLYENNYKFL